MTPPAVVLRGAVVSGGAVLPDGVLAADGGRITWVGPAAAWPGAGSDTPLPEPPVPGALLLPGLVDVHCHGGGGHGFPEADRDGARAAARHHRATGTTALLASLVSAPPADLLRQVDVLAGLVEAGELAGVHLEGPFLAAARCGAQDPASLLPGDPDLLAALLERGRGTVRSMTLAPETPRAGELLALLRRHRVLPSIGHTDASGAEVRAAVRAAAGPDGTAACSATHLFNGMAPLHHRAPGAAGACLAAAARGELVVELIADGVHLADETVSAVFDLVGPQQIALVTDAMAAAGMADGRYSLGPTEVDVRDGVARLAAAGTTGGGVIAGGTSTLLDVLRRTVRHAGVPLADAVTAASATPAGLLGLAGMGRLEPGAVADVLVTDPDLRAVAVLRGGTRLEAAAWRS